MESVSADLLKTLDDPEFCDIRMLASDGEIQVSRTILTMRSHYFRSMLSTSSNFRESQSRTVSLPYSKIVLEKIIMLLYTWTMDCEDMDLKSLLDLMELLNIMNLPVEFSALEDFSIDKIKEGHFPFSDCLKYSDDCLEKGLQAVLDTLLSYLGDNFLNISQMKDVSLISQEMIVMLLEEKCEDTPQTIHRLRTLVTWLSVNTMDDRTREEVLKTLDLKHFTVSDLASVCWHSGLYSADLIIQRMDQLYREKEKQHAEDVRSKESLSMMFDLVKKLI